MIDNKVYIFFVKITFSIKHNECDFALMDLIEYKSKIKKLLLNFLLLLSFRLNFIKLYKSFLNYFFYALLLNNFTKFWNIDFEIDLHFEWLCTLWVIKHLFCTLHGPLHHVNPGTIFFLEPNTMMSTERFKLDGIVP